MVESLSLGTSNAGILKNAVAQADLAPQPVVSAPTSSQMQIDPYLSRSVNMFSSYKNAVIEIRDTSTGSTVKQFPTEAQIRAYSRQQSSDQPSALPLEVRQAVDADTARLIKREVAKKVAVKQDAPAPEPVKIDLPAQVNTQA